MSTESEFLLEVTFVDGIGQPCFSRPSPTPERLKQHNQVNETGICYCVDQYSPQKESTERVEKGGNRTTASMVLVTLKAEGIGVATLDSE